jgi:carboxylate-amine ligase
MTIAFAIPHHRPAVETPRAALDLTYGIEEEFFLIDAATRALVRTQPPGFLRECRLRLPDRVGEEMQQAQVELVTPVLASTAQARETLVDLRARLSGIAERHGMALVASGTHPLGDWRAQRHTDKPRYDRLIDEFQIVGRRNLVNGLHVHVGIPAGTDRVALMNRLMPWAPVFLALSTSSPFWNRRNSGLYSYRQAAYDEWPRSGIPDAFEDQAEYDDFVALLARCGSLRDGSFLWWAIRPSARFPTLELRIADACTRVDDALALAAAFRCLVRAHLRQEELGKRRTAMTRRLIDENRWRAKRHGTAASFIDEQAQAPVPFAQVLDGMLDLIAPDAQALQCESEVARLRAIVREGTSAHAQLALYRARRDRCRSREDALADVVDWLREATRAGSDALRSPVPASPAFVGHAAQA